MSNFNFNHVIIGGRLTAKPELKTTQSGLSVCSFTIAVNRKGGQKQTDFFNCTAWRQPAEFIAKYFDKGASICVTGELNNRTWTDANGTKHYATDIVVTTADFVDSRSDAPAAEPKMEELPADADLPF